MEIRINKEKKQFTIVGNVTAKELLECIQEYSLQEYTMIPHVEVQVVKEYVKDWTLPYISKPVEPMFPTQPAFPIQPPIWYTTEVK